MLRKNVSFLFLKRGYSGKIPKIEPAKPKKSKETTDVKKENVNIVDDVNKREKQKVVDFGSIIKGGSNFDEEKFEDDLGKIIFTK